MQLPCSAELGWLCLQLLNYCRCDGDTCISLRTPRMCACQTFDAQVLQQSLFLQPF
jgi:hypothetical protein